MIVSRPFQDAMRGVGRNALDVPVAALAGLAVAFLAFAMPTDLLTELVGSSGLPSLLPAAEPPLGFKARIGIGLIGAVAAFGLVFLLLRLIDRTGYDTPRAAPSFEGSGDLPKLRRRDAHPDAPGRRPISAARDLGEPAPPEPPAGATPFWLAEADPVAPAAEPEPVAAAPVPEPEPEPEPQPEPEPVDEAPASLVELMARLEQGLARRGARPAFAPASSAPAPPQVFPEASDDRLQSAIDSLQRLASRQS